MSKYSFKLPDLGEGIVESEIDNWHVNIGDNVKEDQHIADVMTDKAVVEVTSPVSGIVLSIGCEAGEVLAVGSELILFEVLESPTNDKSSTDNKIIKKHETTVLLNSSFDISKDADNSVAVEKSNKQTAIFASPSVRRRARENEISLGEIFGTGPSGSISNSDLDNFLTTCSLVIDDATKHKKTASTQIKIRGLRRIIADKMSETVKNIPHYTYVEEIDVTAIEELRLHLNQQKNETQPKLTILPFLMQAVTKVIPQYPHCNAHYDESSETLTQYEAAHLGIATMTSSGLMVPVIKHVEALDLWGTAHKLTEITNATKLGKAKNADLTGSTITLTSLGAIGGLATTPIINAPETAIIGVNKIQDKVEIRNNQIVIRKVMNLSSSFDHRIVDGYDGALFIQTLKKYIENPTTLIT